MLTKRILPVARHLTSLSRNPLVPLCIRKSSYDHPPSGYVYPSMDQIPVPCGDWCTDYCNKQRKYNVQLLFGAGFFVITVGVAYFSGLMWCNMFPPEKPGQRKEMVCPT